MQTRQYEPETGGLKKSRIFFKGNNFLGSSHYTRFIGHKSLQIKHFTLIELLAIIAIIMVLASLLLPSLNKAKITAKTIQCTGNLKQLGLAFIAYSQDSNDWTAPCSYENELLNNWENRFQEYLGFTQKITGTYVLKLPVLICPADEDNIVNAGATIGFPTNYGYNKFMGWIAPSAFSWNPETQTGDERYNCKRLSLFTKPSMAMMGTDILTNLGIINGYDVIVKNSYPNFINTYVTYDLTYNKIDIFRHGGGKANIIYVDGHVDKANPIHMDTDQALLKYGRYYARTF